MNDMLILVDQHDNPVGEMEKMHAHHKAMLHRAVSVFVFNSKQQLLIHRRADNKYHSAGLWTNTACTHPFPNESNEQAALRRLREVMGISIPNMKEIFHFLYKEDLGYGLTEHEYDHVFVGITDAVPQPDPNEVSEYKYASLEEIMEQIKLKLEDFTIWFKKIIQKISEEN